MKDVKEEKPSRFRLRWWSRRRPPRKLKFTREGKFFVGITLGVGFAAINTGNNLLYLLLGMLLSLIVLSGVMSELYGVTGKEQVGIRAVEPVGQYAVKLVFDDGHDTGLYTWQYLQELGREQAAKWARYLERCAQGGAAQRPHK